jgi:hypothetical protein
MSTESEYRRRKVGIEVRKAEVRGYDLAKAQYAEIVKGLKDKIRKMEQEQFKCPVCGSTSIRRMD